MGDFVLARIHRSIKLITVVASLFIVTTVCWYSITSLLPSPSTFNTVALSTSDQNNSTLNSGSSGVRFTGENKIRINSPKTKSSGPVPPPVQNVDILVIVMGEAKSHPMWKVRIGNIEGTVSLLYGSFDEEIPINRCENEYGMDCETAFIPGTTWTQGRNLLAAQAVHKERRRGKEYDYWMFLDDDVDAHCGGGEPMEQLLGVGDCWQKIFNFISSDQVPEKVSTVALPLRHHSGPPGFVGVSNTDAMFAAFKRERVPYLLPYATIREGGSEWMSQAALFCAMQTCMKSSALFVPYVGGRNGAHREYIRGINMVEIRQTIVNNYHDDAAGFHPCTNFREKQIAQEGWDNSSTFNTTTELNNVIPDPELELCEPMKKRFEEWESQITA